MRTTAQILLTAAGLALVMEGLPYFLLAERMPGYLRTLAEQRPAALRLMGLGAMLAGLLCVYLGR